MPVFFFNLGGFYLGVVKVIGLDCYTFPARFCDFRPWYLLFLACSGASIRDVHGCALFAKPIVTPRPMPPLAR